MKKTIFLVLSALLLLLLGCRTEEEAIASQTETGNIRYGISEQDFLQSKFIAGLNAHKIGNAKNTKTTISPEDLAQRLDFEKAHLSSYEGEEILHVPVRVFGSYKRSLLTISRNKTSNAYLLTYPNPEDHRLFYITNLNGELLKEVRIGDDGKEIMQQNTQNKSSVSSKTGDFCTETVYVKCSSGQHSFATGNAYECEFWSNLKKGTPPTLFTVSMPCGGPPDSGGTSPPVLPEPGGPKGGGTAPVGGGGPPKHSLTPSNCLQGIDCENCNIPGDTNNDCSLDYDEARFSSYLIDLPVQEQQWLDNNLQIKNNLFNYLKNNNFNPNSIAFASWSATFFTQNPNVTWTEFWYNKYSSQPNSSYDPNDNLAGNYDETIYADFDFENQQTQWPTINPVISASNFVGWGAPGIKRDCMSYCKAQISKNGYKISNYYDVDSNGNKQTFQIYTEQGGVNQNDLYKGVSYLKYALSKGIPVVVGVDTETGNPHGNLDNTTDHFIVIVGMGTDSKGRYFRFYDNASGDVNQGTHPDNKLYIKYPEKIFTGQTQCVAYRAGTDYNYILTMIRKSK